METKARSRLFSFTHAGLAPTLLAGVLLIGGCSTSPPRNPHNGCRIFEEKSDWYEAARDSFEKWGVPIPVQLAIIYQESRFDDDAKPPRTKLLWVIPWTRKSSAYGYGQVLDATWDHYRRATGNGWADRDDFDDVADFIGWYGATASRKLGIAKEDAYHQYLAYHEGFAGYQKGTYRHKAWLQKVARKVEKRANLYRAQLAGCEDDLNRGWSFWPL